MEATKLPKWFEGTVYKEGGVVTNRFSGESYELNAEELSMYDLIMGVLGLMDMGMRSDTLHRELQKGLMWFRKHNPEAYMVLLD